MAAVSLFRGTNIAAMTSFENQEYGIVTNYALTVTTKVKIL